MTSLLLSLGTVLLLAVVTLTVLGLVTLAPWTLSIGMAERRQRDPIWWGAGAAAVALVGSALGALVLLGKLGAPGWVAVVPLALTWAPPVLLRSLSPSGRRAVPAHH